MYVCMYVCIHILHTDAQVRIYVCIRIYVYTCVYVCICIYIQIHIHMHMHTCIVARTLRISLVIQRWPYVEHMGERTFCHSLVALSRLSRSFPLPLPLPLPFALSLCLSPFRSLSLSLYLSLAVSLWPVDSSLLLLLFLLHILFLRNFRAFSFCPLKRRYAKYHKHNMRPWRETEKACNKWSLRGGKDTQSRSNHLPFERICSLITASD